MEEYLYKSGERQTFSTSVIRKRVGCVVRCSKHEVRNLRLAEPGVTQSLEFPATNRILERATDGYTELCRARLWFSRLCAERDRWDL